MKRKLIALLMAVCLLVCLPLESFAKSMLFLFLPTDPGRLRVAQGQGASVTPLHRGVNLIAGPGALLVEHSFQPVLHSLRPIQAQ